MGAALSVFVILSVSIFVMRLAAVALRITGLSDEVARFQALSAFSGTGFTTKEAETIVNYPVRRRIVSVLMVIGNLGLVSVFATVVVSLVRTDGEPAAILQQLTWLAGGLGLIWFLVLNKTADRLLCALIARALLKTTQLGKRTFHRLYQLGDGYSICEHPVVDASRPQQLVNDLEEIGLVVLGSCENASAPFKPGFDPGELATGQMLIVLGPDASHDAMSRSAVDC